MFESDCLSKWISWAIVWNLLVSIFHWLLSRYFKNTIIRYHKPLTNSRFRSIKSKLNITVYVLSRFRPLTAEYEWPTYQYQKIKKIMLIIPKKKNGHLLLLINYFIFNFTVMTSFLTPFRERKIVLHRTNPFCFTLTFAVGNRIISTIFVG